jgi:iron-sulfur cluster repair protein YtfE (RIC family)
VPQLLYPVVRRLGNKDAPHAGDHLADKSLKEHQEAKELLARLESMDLSHSEWPALFEKLKTSVQTHVMEEESQILPMLRFVFCSLFLSLPRDRCGCVALDP